MLDSLDFHVYLPISLFQVKYAALIKLLKSSQTSLKDLRFNDDAVLFDFPVLSSLKNLTIDVITNYLDDLSMFLTKPEKGVSRSCFPNVETITFFHNCTNAEYPDCNYPPDLIGVFLP